MKRAGRSMNQQRDFQVDDVSRLCLVSLASRPLDRTHSTDRQSEQPLRLLQMARFIQHVLYLNDIQYLVWMTHFNKLVYYSLTTILKI
jgi:hypothetical protein